MTGDDAEVVCGEWDTNSSTEEEYNVVLKIKKIIKHISSGEQNSQFVSNDIAVFYVEDETFLYIHRIMYDSFFITYNLFLNEKKYE